MMVKRRKRRTEEDGEEEPHTDGGDDDEVEIAISSGTPAAAATGQKTIPWCLPRRRKRIECILLVHNHISVGDWIRSRYLFGTFRCCQMHWCDNPTCSISQLIRYSSILRKLRSLGSTTGSFKENDMYRSKQSVTHRQRAVRRATPNVRCPK